MKRGRASVIIFVLSLKLFDINKVAEVNKRTFLIPLARDEPKSSGSRDPGDVTSCLNLVHTFRNIVGTSEIEGEPPGRRLEPEVEGVISRWENVHLLFSTSPEKCNFQVLTNQLFILEQG